LFGVKEAPTLKQSLKSGDVEKKYWELLPCKAIRVTESVKIPAGSRLYVVDSYNYRVQYFRDTAPGVAPASLGMVKAVFR
jgi:hypothetical protein